MQSLKMYFNGTIKKYRQLKQDTFTLIEDLPSLSPIELENRCRTLNTLQRQIAQDNDQLCLLMQDIGPEILDASYLGEYQRAMDTSILACDTLQTEMLLYRIRMHCLA